jgi:hypothetical protein
MCAYPNNDVFISFIDTTRDQKDGHYICNALVGYIKTIGINNIVQICTNNVSNMQNVINIIICYFPSFYFQGYGIHYLDLPLEGWGKTTWVKQIVKKAKNIVSFINNAMCH